MYGAKLKINLDAYLENDLYIVINWISKELNPAVTFVGLQRKHSFFPKAIFSLKNERNRLV